MKRIEKIEQYKGKTLRIDFAEGEPAVINSEVVLDKGLRRGTELSDEEWQVAQGVVQKAIDQLVAFRRQEGEALQHKFEESLHLW